MATAAEPGGAKGDIEEGKQMQITAEGNDLSLLGLFHHFMKHADWWYLYWVPA